MSADYSPEIQKLIDDVNERHEAQSGHSRLWGWFGLSRASFLTIPRVLMHAMPDDWQKRMAILLEEYDEAFPNQPDLRTRVQCVRGNKFASFPEWMLNYRRPDETEIGVPHMFQAHARAIAGEEFGPRQIDRSISGFQHTLSRLIKSASVDSNRDGRDSSPKLCMSDHVRCISERDVENIIWLALLLCAGCVGLAYVHIEWMNYKNSNDHQRNGKKTD